MYKRKSYNKKTTFRKKDFHKIILNNNEANNQSLPIRRYYPNVNRKPENMILSQIVTRNGPIQQNLTQEQIFRARYGSFYQNTNTTDKIQELDNQPDILQPQPTCQNNGKIFVDQSTSTEDLEDYSLVFFSNDNQNYNVENILMPNNNNNSFIDLFEGNQNFSGFHGNDSGFFDNSLNTPDYVNNNNNFVNNYQSKWDQFCQDSNERVDEEVYVDKEAFVRSFTQNVSKMVN